MNGLIDDPFDDIMCDKGGIAGEDHDDFDALIVDMNTASQELKDYVFRFALSMYLGETCPYCTKQFTTIEQLDGAVFNGYTDYGRIAHKECFEKAHGKAGDK